VGCNSSHTKYTQSLAGMEIWLFSTLETFCVQADGRHFAWICEMKLKPVKTNLYLHHKQIVYHISQKTHVFPYSWFRASWLYINKIQRVTTMCMCLFTVKLLYMFRMSTASIIRKSKILNARLSQNKEIFSCVWYPNFTIQWLLQKAKPIKKQWKESEREYRP
jgi:hypothetical protein